MFRSIRRFISPAVVLCALTASSGPATSSNSPASKVAISPAQVATQLMEVRLRRLHLMRPDLIPYPIAYEVVC